MATILTMRTFTAGLWVVGLWMISALPAQAPSGGIAGKVLAPDGLPLPRAVVQAGGRKATTSLTGEYQLKLPPGSYDVTIEFPNIQTFQAKGVAVTAKDVTRLDARMEGGQLATLGESFEYSMNTARTVPPPGPTPRTADGKPDLTGIWKFALPVDQSEPHWLPAAVAAVRARVGKPDQSPGLLCQGHYLLWPNPRVKMVQTPAVLILMYEDEEPGFQQVFLDGRQHPADANPTWRGHAIGRWEGDTLVVDRADFNNRSWLDAEGHPHSEKLHIVERYRRPDLGHLQIEITVEDPEVLEGKWTIHRETVLSANDELQEFLCADNNRYLGRELGK
jgi:hypothetical protein